MLDERDYQRKYGLKANMSHQALQDTATEGLLLNLRSLDVWLPPTRKAEYRKIYTL